jgi:YidC/Oxa1 family membrane protein insertase
MVALILMLAVGIIWIQFFSQPPVQPTEPRDAAPVEQAEENPGEAIPSPVESDVEEGLPVQPDVQTDAWPNLPPVEYVDAPDIVLENNDMRLVFTPIGGRLKRAYAKLHEYGESEVQLVPQPPFPAEGEAEPGADVGVAYPLGLEFTDESLGRQLDMRVFEVLHTDEDSVTFGITLPGAARIEKHFVLSETPHCIDASVRYTSLEDQPRRLGRDQTPAYWLTWGPNITSGDLESRYGQDVVWREDGENESLAIHKLEPDDPVGSPDAQWIAVKSAYFLVGFRPDLEEAPAIAEGAGEQFSFGVGAPRFQAMPGEPVQFDARVYLGPAHIEYLNEAWPTLATAKRFFSETWWFMDSFAKLLLGLLNWFYGIIPNYGVAIILLTLVVRMLAFPLTWKSMRSMKRMQTLAPEMEEIKKKYSDDQQEMQKQMMELYRSRGVNPIGGCLPMLLQMPVFIALYRMLWSAYELRGSPFVLLPFLGDGGWISDLSQPDQFLHLPFLAGLPFVGTYLEYLNILPILGAIAILASQRLMPAGGPIQSDQQKLIMNIMPIFFAVICYQLAAGLNLYILTSTVIGIAQNKIITATAPDEAPPPVKKKTPGKKQHFYAAAQAKKRQAAKEAKAKKKSPPGTVKNTARDRKSK